MTACFNCFTILIKLSYKSGKCVQKRMASVNFVRIRTAIDLIKFNLGSIVSNLACQKASEQNVIKYLI